MLAYHAISCNAFFFCGRNLGVIGNCCNDNLQ